MEPDIRSSSYLHLGCPVIPVMSGLYMLWSRSRLRCVACNSPILFITLFILHSVTRITEISESKIPKTKITETTFVQDRDPQDPDHSCPPMPPHDSEVRCRLTLLLLLLVPGRPGPSRPPALTDPTGPGTSGSTITKEKSPVTAALAVTTAAVTHVTQTF